MAEEREFRVELQRPSEGVAIVAAEGEIAIFTAPRLQETLAEALESVTRRLIVDITSVSFIDSTGLSVLIGARAFPALCSAPASRVRAAAASPPSAAP
jgi:anti-anti-sigma factor